MQNTQHAQSTMRNPAQREAPIGIFDSGLGGLTVFEAIRRLLPEESLLYLGDTARVPYGIRSAETILRYSLECCEFLAHRAVKAIVIACNTASAHALPYLTRQFHFPLLGVVEPGVEAALAQSRGRGIGVIGTAATIASNVYAQQIKERSPETRVISLACPLLVPLVEEGWLENEVALAVVKRYLEPLQDEKIDTLILGCTHYPLLKPMIQKVIPHQISLVDSAESVAHALQCLLAEKEMLAPSGSRGDSKVAKILHELYVTDLPARFESIASRFLGHALPPVKRVAL